jgi:hypothetical protein
MSQPRRFEAAPATEPTYRRGLYAASNERPPRVERVEGGS